MSTNSVPRRPERRKLWAAPWHMSGSDVRAAATVPPAARIGFFAVVVVLAVGLQFVPYDAFVPALIVYAGVMLLLVVGFRGYLLSRRRRAGLVQVTPSEFDMLCALTQAPPDRIAQARELQHQWVAARRAAGAPDAVTAQLDGHIQALFRAPSAPGFSPHE